jgi:hypothetical protein
MDGTERLRVQSMDRAAGAEIDRDIDKAAARVIRNGYFPDLFVCVSFWSP